MKPIAILLSFVFSWESSPICAQQRIPIFELHASANHPFGKTRTFYGGGFGGNVVFRDMRTISFKTGFEANFFHTWNKSRHVGQMASSSNVHYHFWNLSIPLMIRLNVGKRTRFFAEAGGYLGFPLTGTLTSRYTSYGMSPQNPGYTELRTEKFNGYFSLSPAISLGGIFPVSRRVDLILKSELALQKNVGVYESPATDFNARFYYFRLCLGMRINLNNEME
ncbi:hypothetical protein [Fluviicola sp.]|uniref:hypothetical protein n=1 Tax=Fluviicola sp. TaxID=1917219 RepID=UPI0031E30984